MEAMRKTWTDTRLDDFVVHVDRRFDAVDHRFELIDRRFDSVDERFEAIDRRFDSVDHRFEAIDLRFGEVDRRLGGLEGELRRVNDRLDGMQRTMVHAAIGISAATFAGYAAVIGLVTTQL
jgi:hypothetical protein